MVEGDDRHWRWRLRIDGERRHEDAKGEGKHQDEPDDMEPHGDLLLSHPGAPDRHKDAPPSLVKPNASAHLLPEAGATEERTL